jgi:predicted DNA-binding transcriptional regulator AlpA
MTHERTPAPLTIAEFIQRQKISRASFYTMLERGEGPRTYRIGNLVRISADAETAWVRAREAEALLAARVDA